MIGPPSFDDRHYVPVLRVAPGELNALARGSRHLPPLDSYTPLFLVIPKSFYERKPRGSRKRPPPRAATSLEIDRLLDLRAADIAQWGLASGLPRRAFVDVLAFDENHHVDSLGDLIAKIDSKGYHAAVPVTYLHKSGQHAAIRALQAKRPAIGAALRLIGSRPIDWRVIGPVLQACGVSRQQTDLILDMGAIDRKTAKAFTQQASDLQPHISSPDWRSITLLSGAVMRTQKYDQDETIGRYDWIMWRAVRNLATRHGYRLCAFGDYGFLPPSYELPPYQAQAMPYVTYTSDRRWVVRRSRAVGKKSRSAAYHRICAHLVARPEYRRCSAFFSPGDRLINDVVSDRASKYGLPGIWVEVMTSHHMFYVTRQLAHLP